ncbi:hypothetical protein, partial [Pontibacter flavimaris]|uniref:hypothetical protein n=1 Tax=Pontibacter flavimaris TaxID=1797110 RepID=UPI00197EE073
FLPLQPASKGSAAAGRAAERERKKTPQGSWELRKDFRPLHPATARTVPAENEKETPQGGKQKRQASDKVL